MATRGASEPGSAVTSAPAPVTAPAPKAAAKHSAAKAKAAQAATAGREAASGAAAAKPGKAPSHAAAKPAAPAQPAAKPGTPAYTAAKAALVSKALGRGDAVVFFFTRPGAADDTGTREAIKALAGVDHVTVVRAGLNELTTYRPVLSGAGVSQVPAVVVAHAGKQARLLEGYVDGGTIRQTVADALR